LAVDPRSRRVGWAYFQDGILRDCRIKTIRDAKRSVRIGQRTIPFLIELLDNSDPHALLIPRLKGGGTRARSADVAKAVRALVREAVRRGIAVHIVSHDTVRKTFVRPNGSSARSWEDVCREVATQFPELTVMVPKPRLKIWQPEEYFTPLFNAVAMYIAWRRRLSLEAN
jgi:hypothetical protein